KTFFHRLFDENALSHLAWGAAYLAATEGLEGRSDEELQELGLNRSAMHTDFMVGGREVEVDGVEAGGAAVPLLRDNVWQLDGPGDRLRRALPPPRPPAGEAAPGSRRRLLRAAGAVGANRQRGASRAGGARSRGAGIARRAGRDPRRRAARPLAPVATRRTGDGGAAAGRRGDVLPGRGGALLRHPARARTGGRLRPSARRAPRDPAGRRDDAGALPVLGRGPDRRPRRAAPGARSADRGSSRTSAGARPAAAWRVRRDRVRPGRALARVQLLPGRSSQPRRLQHRPAVALDRPPRGRRARA